MPEGESQSKPSFNIKSELSKLIPARFKRPIALIQSASVTEQEKMDSLGTNSVTDETNAQVMESVVTTSASSNPDFVSTPLVETEPTELTLEPTLSNIASIDKEVKTPKKTGIANLLQSKLKEPDMTIPEIKTRGVSAIIGTNETVGFEFFESVQAENPDGYIVGVGAGDVFSMIHCFPDGIVPKAFISADIDPKAVAVGKLLTKNLKATNSAETLNKEFFGMPETKFQSDIVELINEEEDSRLKDALQKVTPDIWQRVWTELGKREAISWNQNRSYDYYEGQNIDVVGAILDKFLVLKQLADEDNMAFVYGDFTNTGFVREVTSLPDFEESTNLIYFSNIADHITQRGYSLKNIKNLELLDPLYPKDSLYMLVADHLFLRAEGRMKNASIFIDRISKSFMDDFDSYLKKRLNTNIAKIIGKIKHQDSRSNNLLQLADMVCGAIYRKYNRGDDKFYKIIKKREEDLWKPY